MAGKQNGIFFQIGPNIQRFAMVLSRVAIFPNFLKHYTRTLKSSLKIGVKKLFHKIFGKSLVKVVKVKILKMMKWHF